MYTLEEFILDSGKGFTDTVNVLEDGRYLGFKQKATTEPGLLLPVCKTPYDAKKLDQDWSYLSNIPYKFPELKNESVYIDNYKYVITGCSYEPAHDHPEWSCNKPTKIIFTIISCDYPDPQDIIEEYELLLRKF